MKAIASALAALPRFVWQRVCIAGEWISQLIALPALPLEEAAQNESGERAQPDEHLDAVRQVAALLYSDRVPTPDLVGKLSQQEMLWLSACNQEMLRSIARAKDPELSAHIKGRKSLKGVLINDAPTIAEYLRDGEYENAPQNLGRRSNTHSQPDRLTIRPGSDLRPFLLAAMLPRTDLKQ
ncbi:hypothetical protein [Pelagibacterium luteolum]|uniref:hypothetical protein n=1 Tax=Pelagibacterium luteolum TaxID=440168 RepID=UPI00115FF9C0|nr:hypothetical protein [Pelagibacterium luteolum]